MAPADSPPDLSCLACGTSYAAGPDEPWRCDCGHALEFAERPLPETSAPPDFDALDARRGLWAFAEFLPVSPAVTLGEGFTPLVDADAGRVADDWAGNVQFKLEYVFPSGSFKDRGATATLSRAAELGVERVVEDSSGNAGAAIAQYAARAGIDADIYVPADAKQSKLDAIERVGATAVKVEGTRQDVTDACVEAVESDESGWYASHAWNPAFFAGTATFAYEVAAQRDWAVPDAVVLPLGHGTLFLGAYRGFRALKEAGWTDRVPRLLGAQAAGYAPIVEALRASEQRAGRDDPRAARPERSEGLEAERRSRGADAAGDNSVADGIQITEPARRDQILAAIEETDGDAIALAEPAVEDALARLRRGGFYVEPTSAAAPAALELYRERGVLDESADVVVPLTGSGLKG